MSKPESWAMAAALEIWSAKNINVEDDAAIITRHATRVETGQEGLEAKAMRALEHLTPGGSEFVGDVDRCVETIKQMRDMEHRGMLMWVKRANEAEAKLASLGTPERTQDESGMPRTDDIVIATSMLLVPNDMRCHKCGATEPWKDSPRRATTAMPSTTQSGSSPAKEDVRNQVSTGTTSAKNAEQNSSRFDSGAGRTPETGETIVDLGPMYEENADGKLVICEATMERCRQVEAEASSTEQRCPTCGSFDAAIRFCVTKPAVGAKHVKISPDCLPCSDFFHAPSDPAQTQEKK